MQDLMVRAQASPARIDRDKDFLLQGELWIKGKIDMAEMRERYGYVRDDRVRDRRSTRASSLSAPSQEPF